MLLIILMIVFAFLAILSLCIEQFGAFASWFGLFVLTLLANELTGGDWEARRQQVELEAKRAAIPHVIREADGCKVYAFTTDREHYFTRCGSTVTTETNWTVGCGKGCTRHESDTIATEGNK